MGGNRKKYSIALWDKIGSYPDLPGDRLRINGTLVRQSFDSASTALRLTAEQQSKPGRTTIEGLSKLSRSSLEHESNKSRRAPEQLSKEILDSLKPSSTTTFFNHFFEILEVVERTIAYIFRCQETIFYIPIIRTTAHF